MNDLYLTIKCNYSLNESKDGSTLSIQIQEGEPCKVAEFSLESGVLIYEEGFKNNKSWFEQEDHVGEYHSRIFVSLIHAGVIKREDIENGLINRFIEGRGYHSYKVSSEGN